MFVDWKLKIDLVFIILNWIWMVAHQTSFFILSYRNLLVAIQQAKTEAQFSPPTLLKCAASFYFKPLCLGCQ